jgi:phage/plasmid-like protein (TIGR03299 family)
MAYSLDGGTPWHGLGDVLSDPSNLDLCRTEAGLDWDVRLESVVLASNGAPVTCGNAVVRCDTGEALSLVGPAFQPLCNRDAFEWFRPWIESGEATIETAGELLGGNRVWILAKVAGTTIDVGAGDIIEPYILLAHGHGGPKTLAIRAGMTATRVVCHNTLTMAIGASDFGRGTNLVKIPHTSGAAASLEHVKTAIDAYRRHCANVAEFYRLLAATPTTDADVKAIVDAIYGAPAEREDGKAPRTPRLDEILRLYHEGVGQDLTSAKGTAWGLVNAISEYETHYATGEAAAKNVSGRLNGLAFGQNGARIARAFDLMRERVQAS